MLSVLGAVGFLVPKTLARELQPPTIARAMIDAAVRAEPGTHVIASDHLV